MRIRTGSSFILSPHDLDGYYREVSRTIQVVQSTYGSDCTLEHKRLRSAGYVTIQTRVTGDVRHDRIHLEVSETFNAAFERGEVDKVYRYRFLSKGVEILRMETQNGYPDHAHFPPRYLSGTGRHFNSDRWPDDLRDMNFIKAFTLWTNLLHSGGVLPEPFKSA